MRPSQSFALHPANESSPGNSSIESIQGAFLRAPHISKQVLVFIG